MNKADLISLVEARVGSRRVATDVVESIFDAMIKEVAGGGKVAITGFGTFEAAQRAPRTGRNPRTGEAVPIGQTVAPRFKAGTTFRAVVADPGLLAESGSLVRRAPVGSRRALALAAPEPAEKPAKADKAPKPAKAKSAKPAKPKKKSKKK